MNEAYKYHKYLIEHYSELPIPKSWSKGLIIELNIGWDYRSKSFTFPLYNAEGEIIGIHWHRGKSSGDGSCKWYPLHFISRYDNNKPLILDEGEKDCISMLSLGHQVITATLGANNIPKDLSHLKPFKEIIILYDNDKAGIDGSQKLANHLKTCFSKTKIRIGKWKNEIEGYDVTDSIEKHGDTSEIDKIISEAEEINTVSKEYDTFKEFSQSDAGNAELLVNLFGDEIRFNHTQGIWLIWNGHYWKLDEKKNINELAKQSAKYRHKQALTINDTDKKRKEAIFALRSEDQRKIIDCINSAKTIDRMSTSADDWNTDPLSLQCDNGLLILTENVEFVKGKPEYMISKSTRIKYDPNEKCLLWEKTILEIFSDDEEMVRYFQRCVGYTLTGLTCEQKFFLLFGTGANGKTVIFEILRELMGDYAINTRFDTFVWKYNKPSNEIARLHQSRLVTASESGDAKNLDSELLKEVTGGDIVTGRFLYNESFDFSPQFKLWLASNSLPTVTDTSLGFWRRVQIIKLFEIFIGDKADLDLVHKLKGELPGILNWAVDGFKQYAKTGLNPPKKVTNAVNEYRSDSDIVSKFVDECIIESINDVVTAKYLYQCFSKWYDENYAGKPITQIMFGKRMHQIGHISVKIGGVKKYLNIKIR